MINQLAVSIFIAAIAFWGAFQLYPKVFPKPSLTPASFSLQQTIEAIKLDLAEIAATPGETAGLVLDTVSVELQTQRQKDQATSASLAVPVFQETKLKTSETTKFTQGSKISVSFVAPAGDQLLSKDVRGTLDLSELVLAARQALLETANNGTGLLPKSVKIELNFILVTNASRDGQIKAYVIEVGGKSEQIETAGNKIVLEYVNPKFAKEEARSGSSKAIPPI